MVWLALSVIPDDAWRRATLPLFEEGVVDALEWSPDQRWRDLPDWTAALLDHYAAAGRLDLHGVTLSPFGGAWTPRQARWLERFAGACARWRPRRVSEHVGFMAGGPFTQGAPLPPAPLELAIAIGRDRLARLVRAARGGDPRAQVGLEPLALALSPADVDDQAALLRAVLAPGRDLPDGGFLVLDLHNAWCQALNAGRDVLDVLDAWPLERARALHLSGGSWSTSRLDLDRRPLRRDTHDDAIPDELLELLPRALERAPGVEVVVVERLGPSLLDPAAAALHVEQVRAVRALLPADAHLADDDARDVASIELREEPARDEPPHDEPQRDMHARDVHPRDVHPRDVHPRDVHPRDVHPRDMRARDVHPRDVHARDVHARDVHARDDDIALAAAQAALLVALEAAREPADLEALRAARDDALAPLREQLARAEPRALEVAADLVRRWGRRGEP